MCLFANARMSRVHAQHTPNRQELSVGAVRGVSFGEARCLARGSGQSFPAAGDDVLFLAGGKVRARRRRTAAEFAIGGLCGLCRRGGVIVGGFGACRAAVHGRAVFDGDAVGGKCFVGSGGVTRATAATLAATLATALVMDDEAVGDVAVVAVEDKV